MANRSYLYTANNDLSRLRDVSEWNYDFPLFHKIVLGANTEISNSKIWNYEHPIAIKGNFTEGLNRLYALMEYLKTQKQVNQELLLQYEKETREFFKKHPDRVGELFFLEGGEVFDMMGDSLKDHNESLYKEITSIAADIVDILAQKPADVFEFKKSHWLNELKKDTATLEVYWTHVTYFSFNKS